MINKSITLKEAKMLFKAGALLECKIITVSWYKNYQGYVMSIPSVTGDIEYFLVSHREKHEEYRYFKTIDSAKKVAESIGFGKAILSWI